MAYPNVAPYGSWKSPITADVVAAGEVGLEQLRLDGVDVYWIERRSQGGRKKGNCAPFVGRTGDGHNAGRLQCSHPGPRIRRRRLCGFGRDYYLLEFYRSTPLYPTTRLGAEAFDPGCRYALRRRSHRPPEKSSFLRASRTIPVTGKRSILW